MKAAVCLIEALRGDKDSPEAIAGALFVAEGIKWLIGIGRGLANVK